MQPTLLDAVALPTEPPTEIRLFKDGWNDTTKGKFLLDAEGAALILADFASHGIELAMDFDHSTYGMAGKKRDVPGYIGALEYRPGEGLFATNVRWTDVGLAAITPGSSGTLPEYRYFSPAIRFDADTGRILAIEPVALVTWPATKNQPPLVMSSAATDTEKHKMNPQLLMLLGLATTATESDVLLKLTALSKENAETLAANKTLATENTALRARLNASERQSLFDQGRREHKLTPALEALFANESPEKVKAFLAVAPVIAQLAAANHAPPAGAATTAGTSAQLSAVLAKPYEQWTSNERVMVRESSPETFNAKREDAIERRVL